MINASFKQVAKKSLVLRHFARWYISKTRYFDWSRVLDKNTKIWRKAFDSKPKNSKILIATSVGSQLATTHLEGLLGVALTLRNADVHFLLCDTALPACMACEVAFYKEQHVFNSRNISKKLCHTCFLPAFKAYQALGLSLHRYSEYLSSEDIEASDKISSEIPLNEIPYYVFNQLAVGEHAYAGALRFFARGDLNDEPYSDNILRQYLKASLLSAFALQKLLKNNSFDCAVFNHGIYIPHGLVGEVCRSEGVRVINWNPAYKKKCFIFSHHDTYHHTMITESREKWVNMVWSDTLENKLMGYLKNRWKGIDDWIWFHKKPTFELQDISNSLGIDFSKPCVGLLTSVLWDAALHYPSNAFPNMLDWVMKTIDYFSKRNDLQLIIRVHPAEIQGGLPSRQRIADEIRKVFPEIPKNVFLITPENNISTYAVMHKCDGVIIYNTKTGIELTAMGIPVIVAGEAWIRNKGFAIDIDNQESYYKILDQLPFGKRMTDEDILRAKKYAYYFFFQRMIPLEFIKQGKGNPPYKLDLKDINQLTPGQSRGLDTICEGIMSGTEFAIG